MKHTSAFRLLICSLLLCINAGAQELESYYFEKNYIVNKIQSIPKGKSFIFITDSHIQRNAGTQTLLPAYVASKADIGMTVFGGDCYDWAPDADKAKEYLSSTFSEYERAFGERFLWVQGNHDCNSSAVSKYKIPHEVAQCSDKEIYEMTIGRIAGRISADAGAAEYLKSLNLSTEKAKEAGYWAGMHYFFDDTAARIRYIILETQDNGNTTKRIIRRQHLIAMQESFLKSCLETVPKGYDVVVAGHMFAHGSTGPLQDLTPWFKDVCEFRKSGKGRVVMICGHSHVDDAFALTLDNNGTMSATELGNGAKLPKDAVLLTLVSCDGNASYQKYAAGGAERIKLKMSKAWYPMLKGTVREHCFDVVTFAKREIRFTRIGAGEDRRFRYRN